MEYVDMKIMQCPTNQFCLQSIVTKNFFESVNNITDSKIHLHHFQVA